MLWGCGTNNNDEPTSSSFEEYYVKYEADVKSVYIGNNIKYTVYTDTGVQTFTSGKTFSQTFGPVKKDFEASITADANSWEIADCNVRIYVCRGNEPFALKANKSGGKAVTVSYIIDY